MIGIRHVFTDAVPRMDTGTLGRTSWMRNAVVTGLTRVPLAADTLVWFAAVSIAHVTTFKD